MTPAAIIITYPFPLGNVNGGSRMTLEIARHIGRRGIPVYLIPVSYRFKAPFPRRPADDALLGYEFDEALAADNVRVIRVNPSPVDRYLDGLGVRREIEKLLEESAIAAVLSYHSESVHLPRLLKKRQIPFGIIATWQSYEQAMRLPSKRKPLKFAADYIKRQTVINSYRKADRLFATSDHTGRELVELVGVQPERIRTCYLGVSPVFADLPRPKPERIKRFLFFGRVIESKGVGDAIKAFGRLRQRGYQDWQFDIYGSGRHEWAQSLINDEQMSEQITLHEALVDEALHRVLVDSQAAVLPSHLEAFGLSFAEAQAAGLPVIAFAAGSVPENVAHGASGWLAPIHDVEKLADYLALTIDQPEQSYEMGLAGRERVKASFTWDKTVDVILDGLGELK